MKNAKCPNLTTLSKMQIVLGDSLFFAECSKLSNMADLRDFVVYFVVRGSKKEIKFKKKTGNF